VHASFADQYVTQSLSDVSAHSKSRRAVYKHLLGFVIDQSHRVQIIREPHGNGQGTTCLPHLMSELGILLVRGSCACELRMFF